jgi:hypothetical protein
MKNILVLSDFHCGHKAGLTPPGWLPEEPVLRNLAWVKASQAVWAWYQEETSKRGPYDIVIVNGDLIDGKGKRSGGSEQITCDLDEQADMAVDIIRRIPKTKKCRILMTRGTPYHSSEEGEDWEDVIAQRVDAEIGDHLWVDIEGVIFDLKHQPAGSSAIPHGRHTGIARDRLWNVLWHTEKKHEPKSNILIRSHVHYHAYSGGPNWLGIVTPALQTLGTKYGARRCVGIVDYGFITFTVNKGEYQWQAHIAELTQQKAKLLKI